jgi:hypothetical protein
MPKYYDGNKIKNLIEKIYGQEKIKNSRLGILYGSRKPYSDIDLFIVSDDIENFDNEWLDIFSKTPGEFEEHLRLFAVSLRDPLLKGELIFGDRVYFKEAKERWLTQQIREEAIKYNIQRHLELKETAEISSLGDEKRAIAKNYSESYLKNALALRQGRRMAI